MPFFQNIPAYRPPVSIVMQPARNVPSLAELGVRVIENIKTSVIIAGMLAQDKVTVRDTGCGDFVNTGVLARFITNTLSVDKLMAAGSDCAETYENTILQGMLHAGHHNDSDLTGTEIEKLVRAYLEGGSNAISPQEMQTVAGLLDLALSAQITPTTYRDALRIWMLGDKSSADVNYNQTDGIRKKLLTANPTANSLGATGTYRGAAINLAALNADPKTVFDLLEDLTQNCSNELQDADEAEKAIYLSKSLYRLVYKAYRAFPNLETSKLAYLDGSKTLSYDGIKIIEFKPYEQFMKADFPASSPNLALYTLQKNLIFATDLESDLTTAEFFYEQKTRYNFWRVLYRLGSGFAYDILVSFAI